MMQAVIIAAGLGRRLRGVSRGRPKPLVELAGLPLIERVILTAKNAGVHKFVIVVGYRAKEIMEEVGDGSKYGVNIEYVKNNEWKRGNGLSLLKAKHKVKGRFFLLMADHIFESRIIEEMRYTKLAEDECLLATDSSPPKYINVKEATKVFVKNGYVKHIGKNLKEYNAVDCGIFLLSPSIFDAVEKVVEQGADSLSDAIRLLAKQNKVRVYDVKNNFWIDVDTEEDYLNAKKQLLKRLKKPTDGLIARHLNRPISIRISEKLASTNITPNAMTCITFFTALCSGILFAFGSYISTVVASLTAQLSAILDGCDGEIARLKLIESKYGGWFDAILDRYADAAIIFGMAYGAALSNPPQTVWVSAFFALLGSVMNSYTAMKYDEVFKEQAGRARFGFRFGRDFRLFIVMVGGLINQLLGTIVLLAVITNAESIRRLYVIRNYAPCCTLTPRQHN